MARIDQIGERFYRISTFAPQKRLSFNQFLADVEGGRTPKAGGRLLDGRTWDELPVQTRQQEQTPSIW